MVSVSDFRLFLGFSVEGSGSRGLITLRRKPPIPQPQDKRPIEIPKNTSFYANNIRFYNDEPSTISESADFIPLLVQSRDDEGFKANLPPNQEWTTDLNTIDAITIENTQAFSGATDKVPGQYSYGVGELNQSNAQLQRALDVGKGKLLKELGLSNSEEDQNDFTTWLQSDPEIREAQMVLGMWYLQQNTSQSLRYSVPMIDTKFPDQEKYFRWRDFPGIMRQVRGLISHRRKVEAFMPTLEEATSA